MRGATVTPVAVIGMACRLPGAIDSPQALWEALLRGDDLVGEIPAQRWDADAYYDPEPGVPGRSVSRWGAFLDDVGGFDADFFGMTDREATAVDPQHRLLLETSWDAVEHAGLDPAALARSRTGVFVGLTHGDYELLCADVGAAEGPYGFTGTSNSFASGRVAYALGLHGPAVTVDTACSSGLMAIHQGCRSLHDGESDLALAGGVAVTLEPRKSVSGSLQGMLSPSGRCRAFDAAADGFVSGEGCVVLLLKRLADAQRDGDRILAVVRGTAANQDGRTATIATPSEQAQIAVYREALRVAGVDAATVGLVEAHGTGTPTGDPIEYASLAAVYGTAGPCALTSVKTNFGHLQSTSGPLGMMKAILALQHGVVPRNLHFTGLPAALATIETGLAVPVTTTPWPRDDGRPRRAAVSSYGLSGTNVHAVLEQAPATQPAAATESEAPQLFPISSTSAEQLRTTAGRLADWLDGQDWAAGGGDLRDLGYTLARRRAHRPVRTAVTAGTAEELSAALRAVAGADTPCPAAVGRDDRGPVWVFSGQGSQWAGMGSDLLDAEPVFAATVAALEPVLAAESGFSVTETLRAPQTVTGLDRVQPTLFALQVGLAETMKSYGVYPGAVIGHSLGEVAAAVVSGALTLDDGAKVICRRSALMARMSGSGAMAAVELPSGQVLSQLSIRAVSDVVLAVVASPTSTVIGGDAQSVRELVAAWERNDVLAREVAVDVASHSPQVDPILDDLIDALADLEPMTPDVPYYSATTWDARERPSFTADYWADNLRYTVRFAAAVQAALEDGFRVFGELSPHPLLTHAVEQNAAGMGVPVAALAALRRGQRYPDGLRDVVADVHSAGAAVDFSRLYPDGRLLDAPLPTWTHRDLMLTREPGAPGASVVAAHPLLGAHVQLFEEPERHVWQGDVGTATHPWLADHRIHGVAALPGAAYCEMALAAAHTVLGERAEVVDVVFEQTLLLDPQTTLSAQAQAGLGGGWDFTTHTRHDGESVRRSRAELRAGDATDPPPPHDVDALCAGHGLRRDGAELRNMFSAIGIDYGTAFGGLAAVHTGDGRATLLAEVALPGAIRSQQTAHRVHPALLDACFQSIIVHPDVQRAAAEGGLLLPVGVRRMRLHRPVRDAHFCLTRITSSRPGECEADLEVLDRSGTVLLSVEGLRLGAGASAGERADRLLDERLLAIEWDRGDLPAPTSSSGRMWLVLNGTEHRQVDALTTALRDTGDDCAVIGDDAVRAALAGRGVDGVAGLVVMASAGTAGIRRLVRIVRDVAEPQGEPPRLFVVTRNATAVRSGDLVNLDHAGLRGLLRVVDAEYPHLRTTQIDVDSDLDDVAADLVRQLRSGSDEDETAWRAGDWYTARLRPAPLGPDDRRTTTARSAQTAVRLQIRQPGDLTTLERVVADREVPGPGEIEVAVHASSVNFADVLVAFGRYPTFEGHEQQLGIDFAGIVTAVGPGVTDHRVGDRVGGMSPHGCWSTHVRCDARLAVALPAGLGFDTAAAIPTAHATAWYALHDLARLTAGDSVLIHSGTGGVGQAAIAVAHAAGARIFATAGSAQRRQTLRDMGIEYVYDSRTAGFADAIRADTAGRGVDVVLNSLPGAAQRAGLELLAFGGRFVEIGKRDIYAGSRLDLFPFRRNLSLHAVDLALLTHSHPELVARLLHTVYQQIGQGVIALPHISIHPVNEAAAAVRQVAGAQHTGKVVLDMAAAERGVAVVPPERVPVFRSDGAYIITGGMGGLGRFLAAGMAEAGCGRLVLNSRSEPDARTRAAIEDMRAAGADVVVACGDIADRPTAARLVAAATATGLPVRGVLHAAAVVEDATLANVTDELIEHCWAPKVNGALHLHEATADSPLDWFCVFSSAAALVGSPGQAAYAAANSWLDGFARWRRAQGLPATAIAWGAWAQVGRAHDVAVALAQTAGASIAPAEGAHAFAQLIRHDRAHTGYAVVAGTPWLTAFAARSRFAEGFRSSGQAAAGGLRAELAAMPRDEWPAAVRRMVSDQVGLLLRRTIDPDRPLSDYGLDSLGNLELRTRIEAETGVRVSPAQITTVRALADQLCDELLAAQEPACA
ncbi:sulfolipid-1 biosynthesis phthioceranic/hydroxyphthioceranic acid synthase [Mycobacterium sp. WMMD1722]|uniref:sulfolipid-1 biosynthesis phthioceranic/hydroxyphthioceranic acid synthase n=1 Tax=Mycobacterium sp. WMMD1722 TaxID=3404117 RepID=UPI003BF50C54